MILLPAHIEAIDNFGVLDGRKTWSIELLQGSGSEAIYAPRLLGLPRVDTALAYELGASCGLVCVVTAGSIGAIEFTRGKPVYGTQQPAGLSFAKNLPQVLETSLLAFECA